MAAQAVDTLDAPIIGKTVEMDAIGDANEPTIGTGVAVRSIATIDDDGVNHTIIHIHIHIHTLQHIYPRTTNTLTQPHTHILRNDIREK